MNFFAYFPTTSYVFQNDDVNYQLTMTNLTAHVRIVETITKNITSLYDYQISDGERPDTVAVNLYGTPEFTWVILVVNSIFTLFDWPLRTDEFVAYVIEKYGSLDIAKNTFIYKTVDGYQVDQLTWSQLAVGQRLDPTSMFDDELDKNEAKRRIRVVPAAFVAALAQDLRALLTT